jgi:hypothetical protein
VAAAATAAVSLDILHIVHRLGSVVSPQVGRYEVCTRAGVVLYTGSVCAKKQFEVGQVMCCADSSAAMCHILVLVFLLEVGADQATVVLVVKETCLIHFCPCFFPGMPCARCMLAFGTGVLGCSRFMSVSACDTRERKLAGHTVHLLSM